MLTAPRPWRRYLFTLAFLLTFVVGAFEAVLRLVDYQPQTSPRRIFFEYDPDRGWRNAAHVIGDYISPEHRVSLAYNGRGIRGPERPYEKPAGVYRILLLGDSYVDGYSVPLEARVAEQLEHRLNNAQQARRVEVIALGVGGYSTDQELLWFQSEGKRYQPDLVVLMFYYDDAWFNAQSTYWRGGKPLFVHDGKTVKLTNVPVPDLISYKTPSRSSSVVARVQAWCRANLKLYALSRDIAGALLPSSDPERSPSEMSPSEGEEGRNNKQRKAPDKFTVFKKEESAEVTRGWRTTAALLQILQDSAVSHGARFLAFHIPIQYSVYANDWEAFLTRYALVAEEWDPRKVAQQFLTLCDDPSSCIEPTAQFREAAESLARAGERLYYQRDLHWNENGHALAARILTEHILAHALIASENSRTIPGPPN